MTHDQTATPTGRPDAQHPETTLATPPGAGTDVTDRPIRVLHVDDEPDFGSLLASFLAEHDRAFNVVSELRGAAALERLREERFDCIVSDYAMPAMNGLTLLDEVRETYGSLPFILFTCKNREELARDAAGAGLTEFVQKGSVEQYAKLADCIDDAVTAVHGNRER